MMATCDISHFGGYEVKLQDEKKLSRHKCPLCYRLLRKPIQTERGEIACEICFNGAYKKRNGICPIDKESSNGKTYRDKAKEKEILALTCYCSFEGCEWEGEVRNIENHERECDHRSEKCQFCEDEMKISKLGSHQKECSEMIALMSRGCPITGCKYKPLDVMDLNKHMQENMILHAILQTKAHEKQQTTIAVLVAEKEDRDNEIKVLKEQQQQQEKKISTLENQVSELLEKKEENKKATAENPDITKLSTDVSLMNKQLSDLDLRQQLFENTTFDGKLIWKIDNVAARIQQAKSGRVTALHSAPAFTQRHGYKFCARLYLNGDGLGRNTHFSLFFVLMKSEYDSRLSWPFNRTVKFKLINQENQGSDITESFNPDQQSTSFRRPVRDMNIASGCPRFISIDSFANGGYVKDDCIFLEIETVEMDLSPA